VIETHAHAGEFKEWWVWRRFRHEAGPTSPRAAGESSRRRRYPTRGHRRRAAPAQHELRQHDALFYGRRPSREPTSKSLRDDAKSHPLMLSTRSYLNRTRTDDARRTPAQSTRSMMACACAVGPSFLGVTTLRFHGDLWRRRLQFRQKVEDH
jgi:hypothetical protein